MQNTNTTINDNFKNEDISQEDVYQKQNKKQHLELQENQSFISKDIQLNDQNTEGQSHSIIDKKNQLNSQKLFSYKDLIIILLLILLIILSIIIFGYFLEMQKQSIVNEKQKISKQLITDNKLINIQKNEQLLIKDSKIASFSNQINQNKKIIQIKEKLSNPLILSKNISPENKQKPLKLTLIKEKQPSNPSILSKNISPENKQKPLKLTLIKEKQPSNPSILSKNISPENKQKPLKLTLIKEKQPSNPSILSKNISPENKQKPLKQKNSQKTKNISSENNKISFKLRNSSRTIPKIDSKNKKTQRYQFKLPISSIINKFFKNHYNKFKVPQIANQQYINAIKLMEVTHNINFKGQFVLENYRFYQKPQDKFKALLSALEKQKQSYQEKYQISKYIKNQISFCVVVPSYNNAQKTFLYLRNLDSIFQQQYQNYRVVYINDASPDKTGQYVAKYMKQNQIPNDKYIFIDNKQRQGYLKNLYKAGHQICQPGQVMIFLDGDDALVGRQVFALLNARYQKQKIALTYGQYLVIVGNNIKKGKISKQIPKKVLSEGTFRTLNKFCTSHLKSMYVDVFRQIKIQNLKDQKGNFLSTTFDVSIMTPAIQLVGTRLLYIHQIIYQYHYDTGLNDKPKAHIITKNQIMKKKPSTKMKQMKFADHPKTKKYD